MTRRCESLPAMRPGRLRSGQPITQSPSISGLGITSPLTCHCEEHGDEAIPLPTCATGSPRRRRLLAMTLRPHAGLELRSQLRPQPRLQRFDELAEVRPRLARIDEVFDRES